MNEAVRTKRGPIAARGAGAVPRARGLACALAGALALAGCGQEPERTLLVVEVFAPDLAPGGDYDAAPVTVRSARSGAELLSLPHPVGSGPGQVTLPLRLALVPAADSGEPVVVRAEARLRGTTVVAQEAEVAFVPGQRVRLQLVLRAACVPVRCEGARQTCADGVCIDRGSFAPTPFEPGAPVVIADAGDADAAVVDAASDAPVDAALDAAPAPDGAGSPDGRPEQDGPADGARDAPVADVGSPDTAAARDSLVPGCDPTSRPQDALAVFASPGGDDMGGDGTRLRPVRSIAAAIAVAKATGRTSVLLAPGVYAESVNLGSAESGLLIVGGWRVEGAVWTRDCDADAVSRTVVSGPGVVTVQVTDITQRTGIARLTVTTRSKGGQDGMGRGQSLIGVLVRGAGSVFFLEDVDVLVGEGGDGAPAPATPPTPAAMCAGVGDCGGNQAGRAGQQGANAEAGMFTVNGFVPATPQPGVSGTNGSNGTPGGPGMSMDNCNWGCNGSNNCDASLVTRMTAGQGRCGCGGRGGAGGAGGRSGGASVALLVVGANATVSVRGGRLVAAGGGAGSAGAMGAAPSDPTAGRMGEAVVCNTGGCRGTVLACYYVNETILRGGAPGGTGLAGGRGGDGGHGAGGPAVAIARAVNARVLLEGTQVTHGPGGAAPQGAVRGQSAREVTF